MIAYRYYEYHLFISEPSHKKRKMSIKDGNGLSKKEIGTNLIINDKQNRCLLNEGDYDCIVEEINVSPVTAAVGRPASWERLKVIYIYIYVYL